MTLRYRFIHFIKVGPVWACQTNLSEELLGHCRYFARWGKWEFDPEPGTGFTHDCLQDIAHFLNQLCKPPSR